MIHRGEIVEKAVRSSGIPLTKIASRIGKSRRWVYNAFETSDLSLDVVIDFGKIIYYDFSSEIPQLANHQDILNDRVEPYGENNLEYWREKYYTLLEEHNKLLKTLSGR